jgi:ergothioneine biosynthesis protein EgtB
VDQVYRYRRVIDDAVRSVLDDPALRARHAGVIELGLQHEQQHQELVLTDLKAALACNPTWPVYRDDAASPLPGDALPLRWRSFDEGLRRVGLDASSSSGFAFDNESPRHRVFLEPFQTANRPSTVGEYLEFVEDSGYDRPDLWLSDGWAARLRLGWTSPAYWIKQDGRWMTFTLGGLRLLSENEPVTHLSYHEADAFARWSGARLPTEAEWEVSAVETGSVISGNFAESRRFHPAPEPSGPPSDAALRQLFGDTWEWTASPYVAYPGFQALSGALGEYNGKFMCNQFVLRGGSCVSPRSHLRATYRNFFPAEARWQFSGVRLAQS